MPSNPWDERYTGEVFFYGKTPNDFLREHFEVLPKAQEVLCLAEGEGRNAVFLAERGLRVTGVDGSAVGLSKAQALAVERRVSIQTIVADLSSWELGEACWGSVVSIWCHLPPLLRQQLRPRIVQSLLPGGVFLLEHYHPKQLAYKTGGPPDPAMMTTLDELRQDFSGWKVLHAFEGEREVQEGSGHHGLSYVTQFIAKKSTQA